MEPRRGSWHPVPGNDVIPELNGAKTRKEQEELSTPSAAARLDRHAALRARMLDHQPVVSKDPTADLLRIAQERMSGSTKSRNEGEGRRRKRRRAS